MVGVSRRNITSLQAQSFDFFGQPITVTQEIDSKDRGLVLDAGITQQLESGQISGRISQDNTTNSFGGLDEINKFVIIFALCRHRPGLAPTTRLVAPRGRGHLLVRPGEVPQIGPPVHRTPGRLRSAFRDMC